jgi:hypothetical protein
MPKGNLKNLGIMKGENSHPILTLPGKRKEIKREIRKIYYYLKEITKYFEKREQVLKEESEQWYKEAKKSSKMANIIIRSCCEVKG